MGKRYKDGDATGNAARDGYTCVERRPRSSPAGEIVDLETADRIDRAHEEYGAFMTRPMGGFMRPYED